MTSYVLGNLAGRLLVSYLIVWTVMLLMSKIHWRDSFRRTHRWYGVVTVAMVYALGLFAFVT